MTDVVTVAERKARATIARRVSASLLMDDLKRYAEAKGGRYLVFGSAATDALRHDSDFDVMLDFPPFLESEAWTFAEEACRSHGLKGDIVSASRSPVSFVSRVQTQAIVLR